MMSMSNLSIDGEFRYIIQWFHEWSELQRDDFVYVFVEYLTRGSSVHVNGIVNALATAGVQDKPMSLFQCRIKLFREWSPKWPIEFKCQLQEKINEIDSKVGEKIINELKGHHGGVHNGDVAVHLNENGAATGEDIELEQPAAVAAAVPPPAAAPAADAESLEAPAPNQAVQAEADNDNHLAAVLRQETPVDDDDEDDNEQRASAGDDCNADVNGHYLSATVTTTAVNTSPSTSPSPSPQPQPQPQLQPSVEPVEQVENNVTVSVASPEVIPPVA
ncbi:myosin-1 [Drosophila persimilis]|nr:myosin-1 [Drosophila persimilis]